MPASIVPNVYEVLVMMDSSKSSGNLQDVVQQLHASLGKHKAEILASRPWDERRLAYPIGKQKKASYYLIYFKTLPENLEAIEHDFALNEVVIRSLFINIEPKFVDAMLAVAKDERALALQVAHDSGDEFDMGGRD